MPSIGSCGSCQYWTPQPGNALVGACHRYPPGAPPVYQPSSMGTFVRVQQSDWCGDWVQVTSSVNASVTLQPANGVAAGASVALAQSAGALTGPFTVDALGRLSVTSVSVITVTATFSLSRPVAQGATGQGVLRLPAAADANLVDPVVIAAALVDANGRATCTLTWTASVAANTSIEVDYTNSSSGSQDCQGGTLQVLCRN